MGFDSYLLAKGTSENLSREIRKKDINKKLSYLKIPNFIIVNIL